MTAFPNGLVWSTPVFARETRNAITWKVLSCACLLIALTSFAYSATVAVGGCTALASYPTITQAIASVPAGSTIKICPGPYHEQILITKNLTLTGVASNGVVGAAATGAYNPVITPPSGGVSVNAQDLYDNSGIAAQIAVVTPSSASGPIVVNISNITVDGTGNQVSGCSPDFVGIYYQNANGTINHVTTRNQYMGAVLNGCQGGLGIFAESGYGSGGTSLMTIENNSVHDYNKNGITADGSGMSATITGNYVVGVGPTTLIGQNGIQVSDGADGKVANNVVTDDVYVNAPDCATTTPQSCYSASGILLYDSGGTSPKPLAVSTNTVSNTQGGIVAVGDSSGTADYNSITMNHITTTPAAGPYAIDGIDLCSNNNTANQNFVFNSSGAGIHIDSECTESTGQSGKGTTLNSNNINEACAGVLLGNGAGSTQNGTIAYNVAVTVATGDSCPSTGSSSADAKVKLIRTRPRPLAHQ